MTVPSELARHAPIIKIEEPGRQPLLVVVAHPIEIGRECSEIVLTTPHRTETPAGRSHGNTVRSPISARRTGRRSTGPARAESLLRIGDLVEIRRVHPPLVAEGRPELDVAESAPPRPREQDRRSTVCARRRSISSRMRSTNDPLPPPMETDVGTVTVVFSDIEGSTKRAVELGDSAWMQVLDTHNTIVRRMVARHRGTEVRRRVMASCSPSEAPGCDRLHGGRATRPGRARDSTATGGGSRAHRYPHR